MAATLQTESRAGFFIRALAYALDAAIVLLIATILFALLGGTDMWPSPQRDRLSGLALSLTVLVYSFAEVAFAATPGKLLLRLRIGTRFGPVADRSILFLRWSTKQSPYILMVLDSLMLHPLFKIPMAFLNMFLLCGTLAAFNDDHLAWHDQWSGSAVWKVRRQTGVPQTGSSAVTNPIT